MAPTELTPRYRPDPGEWFMDWKATQIQPMKVSLAILSAAFVSSGVF